MKRIICFLMGYIVVLSMVGCDKIAPIPYELTKEARTVMKKPAEQEVYVNMIKELEALVVTLNDEKTTKEEALKGVSQITKNCPTSWEAGSSALPMDKAWDFIMLMEAGFKGEDGYDNYADCKDAVDALGKELSDQFKQSLDRRKALIVNEERFYQLYGETN